jgi:predicted metal-dependent hydrolase
VAIITDPVLGEITVHRSKLARSIKIRYDTRGRLVVSAPQLTPLFYIKTVISSSRDELAALVSAHAPDTQYLDQQQIGKSHTLAIVRSGLVTEPSVKIVQQHIVATIPHDSDVTAKAAQDAIREVVADALRKQAKAHLPRRLKTLAAEGGFTYEKVRFSHANGRWGSCSSTGTISLNIALMKLPDELIDYVLYHELCHTVEMNHSDRFWRLVGTHDVHYKLHRRQLKKHTPHV